MLIVTAGSDNYQFEKTIRYNKNKAKQFGYDFVVYDLGGLGFGKPVNDARIHSRFRRVKSTMKPELIHDAMISNKEKCVVWIDGDATLIKPIDEMEHEELDVGITVRLKGIMKKTHYINAGVLFFNGPKGVQFVEEWIDEMPAVPDLNIKIKPANYSDQQILEEKILLPAIQEPLWDLVGQVRGVRGFRIKFFPCEVYNNFWCIKAPAYDYGPGNAKIIHFKGHRMHRIDDYHERFLK